MRLFAPIALVILCALPARVHALPSQTDAIADMEITDTTGEKPQSKVWTHDGYWWTVLPDRQGTFVRRLDGLAWTKQQKVFPLGDTQADVKVDGGLVHVLLFRGKYSFLVSLEYDPGTHEYLPWASQPDTVALTLDTGAETGVIDLDSTGRMWLASDGSSTVNVRYADPPYDVWSGPIVLATGITFDDICTITAMPGSVGVLWSNQATQRFGFRTHADGTPPATWGVNEVPASQSAAAVGTGMADDHLNTAVTSDGTLYAAVKTGFDTPGYPTIALLVRHPNGTWDDLYPVDEEGTRPIVLYEELTNTVNLVYTSEIGFHPIVWRQSPAASIAFGGRDTLIDGTWDNASSAKENVGTDIVLLAADDHDVTGVLCSYPPTAVAGLAPAGGVALRAAWPNPFAATTTLAYALARDARVRLEVVDVSGRRVRTLADGIEAAGAHATTWDGRTERGDVASPGVYMVRLAAAGEVRTGKVLLAR